MLNSVVVYVSMEVEDNKMSEVEEMANLAVDTIFAMNKRMIETNLHQLVAKSASKLMAELVKAGFSDEQAIKVLCASLKAGK